MKKMKKLTIFLVVVSLLLCFSVSTAFAGGGKEEEKVLRLGGMGPLTGPAARTGQEFQSARIMAFEDIDYTIGDYKVELIWIDTQSDPARATSAYTEAVERYGIQATLGNWHSSVGIALIDIAARYGIPHYFGPGGASSIINEKYRSDPAYGGIWLKGMPIPPLVTRKYVDAISSAIEKGYYKPNSNKVAIFGEDTDWGRGIGAGFKEQFTEQGFDVVREDYFSLTQTEYHALMSIYKDEGVEILAGTHSGTAAISTFIKTADEVGLKAVICADGLGWVGEWYELTGSSSNYVLDSTPVLVTPEAQDWAKRMRDRFGIDPGGQALISYDFDNFFIRIAERAFEKYGEITSETLLKINIEEVVPGKLTYSKEDGALSMNEIKFSPDTVPDPVFGVDHWYLPIIQLMDGEDYVIFPEQWAERPFQQPK